MNMVFSHIIGVNLKYLKYSYIILNSASSEQSITGPCGLCKQTVQLLHLDEQGRVCWYLGIVQSLPKSLGQMWISVNNCSVACNECRLCEIYLEKLFNSNIIVLLQVGTFPSVCGAESLSSLLDEVTLLRHCNTWGGSDQLTRDTAAQHFRYFVAQNSIMLALLEQPLGNHQGTVLFTSFVA